MAQSLSNLMKQLAVALAACALLLPTVYANPVDILTGQRSGCDQGICCDQQPGEPVSDSAVTDDCCPGESQSPAEPDAPAQLPCDCPCCPISAIAAPPAHVTGGVQPIWHTDSQPFLLPEAKTPDTAALGVDVRPPIS